MVFLVSIAVVVVAVVVVVVVVFAVDGCVLVNLEVLVYVFV